MRYVEIWTGLYVSFVRGSILVAADVVLIAVQWLSFRTASTTSMVLITLQSVTFQSNGTQWH